MVDQDRPAITTPGLEEYLRSPPEGLPRRFDARATAALFRAAHRDPGSEALLSDTALAPLLVVALWRWARAAAQAIGRLSDDETLDAALGDSEPCAWTERLVARPTPSQRALIRQGATSALYQAVSGEGIALLPTREPARWCAAFEVVAEDLGLRRGPRGPDVVRVLSDPAIASLVPVAHKAVVRLEDLMVDQAQRVLFRHGERGVMDHFRDTYGLSRRECLGLVRLARADALQYGRSSVEDDRALMVAQLKDFADRARDAMNMGDEIRALRELARVQGLTRTEPEDKMSEFLGVVRAVSGRQDALQLVSAAADAVGAEPEDIAEGLEGELPIDADFEERPARTEAAALAGFDAADARARVEEEVG
jgi:hypothetical protein